jgi:uncharacterized protein (DUF1786 family)
MGPVLCLDIGSGTQDVLYWTPDRVIENCPKFVLPSPAKRVAARIRELTAKGLPVHLCGHNMGGGFFGAVRGHVSAGLAVSAQPEAALALSDDPASLEAKGVALSNTCPPGHVPVRLADYDPGFWRALLATCGLEEPHLVLACAQDHGHHPGLSSRSGRFALWERFLAATSGRLEDLLFITPPPELTRLAALSRSTGGGPVMDSGPAAALGALTDPRVKARADESGALIVNMGNSHVLGLLVKRGALTGVYEHHTGLLAPGVLADQLDRFRSGGLRLGEVFESGGHGSIVMGRPEGFADVFAIGPRRAELTGMDAAFPAPGGDMMLTGCFGLLDAWRKRAGASA